jgi:RHS repeat-associated protein
MPYGEELFAGTGGRSTSIGFSASDGIRKQFTGYQRDAETNLDFAQARYYSLAEGRFTSADIFGGRLTNPQTLNLYAYVLNNPLKYVDPTGNQDTKPKVEQPKPTTVIDDKGRRQRMTVTISEIGPVDNFTIFTSPTSSMSAIMSGAGSPSVGPRQGPMAPLDTTPRTHRSSLPHIFPRKVGWTEGVTGILANGNNVMGGTLSGFFMHDFVDETTILGETHGGKFAGMDESAGGLMAAIGLGGGIIFSNADDNEINSSSDSYLLSVGPLGVEVDTGQNASKEFIYTTSITLGKSVGAGLVRLPTQTNTTYPLEYHAQRLYDWLHDSWIR